MLISRGRLMKFPETLSLACMVPISAVPFPLPSVNQGNGDTLLRHYAGRAYTSLLVC